MTNGAFYNRSDAQWGELEEVGWDLLLDRAFTMTDYTELNQALARRTGQPAWDFGRADHRAAMGELLGRLTDRSFGESGLMISALCKYMYENDAGDGFYRKALSLGLFSEVLFKNKMGRWEWWAEHVGKVQAWTRNVAARPSAEQP